MQGDGYICQELRRVLRDDLHLGHWRPSFGQCHGMHTYYLSCWSHFLMLLLQINTSGQLFHIDFGFIFGQDPKPLPPPFRFTKSMADAMGGEDSETYGRFKTYCCQSYNWLRKSANLILNLLSLMGDAGINDISKRSDLSKVLLKVEDKFRLDLSGKPSECPVMLVLTCAALW